jgi:hypothetical protein
MIRSHLKASMSEAYDADPSIPGDRSNPSSDAENRVLASFGRAYYESECLHTGLSNLYCFSQLEASAPVTEPRLDEVLQRAFSATLGQLADMVKTQLPASLVTKLKEAVERRNIFAHGFWFDRMHLLTSAAGRESMVVELTRDAELFMELGREIAPFSRPLHSLVVMTAEARVEAFRHVLSGKGTEPIKRRRKFYKEETIVAVYHVPVESGSNLVFQTDDGLLWQLCDAGLGWAEYERQEESWTRAENFAQLLPARINPRPSVSAAWTFEIPFGLKAVLAVRPGRQIGQLRYQLREPGE